MKNWCIALLLGGLVIACSSEGENEADALFRSGKYEEALAQYDHYLELNPGDIAAYYSRGRAHEELGNFEKAKADFEAVVYERPDHRDAWLSLGNVAYRQKDYADAYDNYARAAKADDGSEQAFTLVGKALSKMGETDKALEAFNSALSINGQYSDAYVGRGIVYVQQDQKSKACLDFRRARDLNDPSGKEAFERFCQ